MGNDIVLRKMDSLVRCLKRLEEKQPEDWEKVHENYDLQDILSVNLERAVQISVDLGLQMLTLSHIKPPETMAEVFTALEAENIIDSNLANNFRSAVGFRNIAVHEYQEIDWNIVQSILTRHLGDFHTFIKAVLQFLDSGKLRRGT